MQVRGRLRRLQSARKAADARLHSLPNVVGTCFGFKMTAGTRSQQLCLTVFVRRKVKPHRLKAEQHVPDTVRRHGVDLPTDVVQVGRIENQGGFTIHVAGASVGEKGTLGAWGLNSDGVFGVTCAHCLASPGDIVTAEFPTPGEYIALGPAGVSANNPGTGLYPSYGAFDAGLIRVTTAGVRDYAVGRPAQTVYRPPGTTDPQHLGELLRFVPVSGWGAGSGRLLDGVVTGVLVDIPPWRFDVMIEDPQGASLSVAGDSGLLWTTPIGQAFALHQAGDSEAGGGPSRHAFASFAFRVVDDFGLTLHLA
jgi:hypothetical protein